MKKEETTHTQTAEFQLKDIGPIVIVLVVAGVTAALGLNVMSDVQSDFVTGTAGCNSTHTGDCAAEFNATGDAITGVSKITSKFGIIGTAVAFVIILGIIGALMAQRIR